MISKDMVYNLLSLPIPVHLKNYFKELKFNLSIHTENFLSLWLFLKLLSLFL